MSYEMSMHLVLPLEEWLVGTSPCMWNFGPDWPTPPKRWFPVDNRLLRLSCKQCKKTSQFKHSVRAT